MRTQCIGCLILFAMNIACGGQPETLSRFGALPSKQALKGLSLCSESAPAQSWSVSIGIDHYLDQGIPTLKGASHDAWVMHHYFASSGGGKVGIERRMILLNHQATRANIEFALGKFLENACPQDTIYIYYAGHGAPEPGKEGEAFLFTHDTDLDNLVGTAISMSMLPTFLLRRVERAGRRIMMVDACHSGTINFPKHRGFSLLQEDQQPDEVAKTRSTAVLGQLRALSKESQSLTVLTAASDSQFAEETEDENRCPFASSGYRGGLFTCALIDKVRDGRAKTVENQSGTLRSGSTEVSSTMPQAPIKISELYPLLEGRVGELSKGQQSPQWLGADVEIPRLSIPLVIPQIPPDLLRPPSRSVSGLTWGLSGAAIAAGVTSSLLYSKVPATRADLLSQSRGVTRYEEYQATARRFESERTQAQWAIGATIGLSAIALGSLGLDLLSDPEEKSSTWFTIALPESKVAKPSGEGFSQEQTLPLGGQQ